MISPYKPISLPSPYPYQKFPIPPFLKISIPLLKMGVQLCLVTIIQGRVRLNYAIIHHHPPSPTTSQNVSTTIHHHPSPAKMYPPLPTTTHHQPKYSHHHPPPPTTNQDISTNTHHHPPTANLFYKKPIYKNL